MYEITLKGAMRGLVAKFIPSDGKPIVKGKVHMSKKQRLRERWESNKLLYGIGRFSKANKAEKNASVRIGEEERFGEKMGARATGRFSSAKPNFSQVPSKTIVM